MKRRLITITAVMLLATSITACGTRNTNDNASTSASEGTTAPKDNSSTEAKVDPLAKFPQPVQISLGRNVDPNYKFEGGDTSENNGYTRWLKDYYNIEVKNVWEAAPTDYDQKINISIASDDLPDALVVNETQLKTMLKAGQLADLTDVYAKYGSEKLKKIYDKNPGLLKSVTFDGKLYAFPETTLPSAPLTWIRKDWLDKLGLQPPKTVKDIETITKAFIDNKVGGEGTLGIVGTGQGGTLYSTFLKSADHNMNFSPLFFANNAFPGQWVKDKDGNAAYGSILPETKQALSMMHDWYAKGILDKEIGLRKSAGDALTSGKAGIFFGPWWAPYNLQDAIKNDPNANWRPYAAPVDANGQFNSNEATGSMFVVVKKSYKNPEVVVKMLDLAVWDKDDSYKQATKDKNMTGQEIPLWMNLGAGDQLQYAVGSLRKYLAGDMKLEDFDRANYSWAYEMAEHVKNVKTDPADNYDIQYFDKQKDQAFFPHIYSHLNGGSTFVDAKINYVRSLATSKTKTMEQKWTNLQKLEDETFLKIIMGESSVDEFDKFVETWKKQGGDTITKEVNDLK